MTEKKFKCSSCKEENDKDIFMVEKHDLLICPNCQTSIMMPGKSPLGRYIDKWKDNADELFPLLRPEMNISDFPIPRLFFLYEDCYFTLLIGRFNASIVLMGVLLEALMKERIRLKLGVDIHGAYGECLKKIEDNDLMEIEDAKFLRKFKNKIRNLYQHSNEYEILNGYFFRVWPIEINGELTLEKLKQFTNDIKEKRVEPKILSASNIPLIRSVAKQSVDRSRAIKLFNLVYDFLINAKGKYFKQIEFDEYIKKFGAGLENIEHHKL
jgi:hypothetical protein